MAVNKIMADSILVNNLKTGEQMDEAIRYLYRNHFDSLSRYVLANNGTQQDAEDQFQETIVSFINLVRENKFRGESSIKTFLYAMMRHGWLNELKKRGRASVRELKYENEKENILPDITQAITEREGYKILISLVESLGEACRTILLLFYFESCSMKDILDRTHYENEQVVRNKKYKCLKQLEQMIHDNPVLKQKLKNLLHG